MPSRARLGRLGSGLLLLALAASCDKLPFIGGDEPAETKTAADEAAARQAEIDAAKKAAVEEIKQASEAEIETRVAAEAQKAVEAATKKLEEEAAAKAAAEAKDDRPLRLANLTVKSMGGTFGPSTGMIELRADAEIKQPIGNSTYVHVKAFCDDGGTILTDIGFLNADYSKQLDAYAAGEKAEVTGNLFSQGLDHAVAPCQLSFKLGGMGGGGLSVDLGEGCWDGKQATLAPCEKPIVPVAASGATTPIEVLSIDPQPSPGYGSHGLTLNYTLLFHTRYDPNARLTLKATCTESGKSFVEITQAYVNTGVFQLEPGEAIARNASFFWSTALGFASPPKLCDLTASYWTAKAGSYSEYNEKVLQESCLRDAKVEPGRCDGGSVTRSAPVPMTATNATLDDVKLTLVAPYGTTGQFNLEIGADLTVTEPLSYDQGVTAEVTCKVGAEKRVETAYLYGMELFYLLAGETTQMTSSAFGGALLDAPKSCQVQFKGGTRYVAGGATIDLGTYCLKKEKVKKGKC